MRKILFSLLVISVVISLVVGATKAYFSDTETSTGNTLAAGNLDLNVDGANTNVVKFTVSEMEPQGEVVKGTYTLNNAGTINGYLDLEEIEVTSKENGCLDPEIEAGDATCGDPGIGDGELQDLIGLQLFVDEDCDGEIGDGETVSYDDTVSMIPGNFELNESLPAGQSTCLTMVFDWQSSDDDNLGQGDEIALNFSFELGQTTDQ